MQAWMLRLFKIQPGESGKVLPLTLVGALLQAGVAMGISAADSLFLFHLGADKLPLFFVIMPLLMLVAVPVYAYLLERCGVDVMMDATLFAMALGGGALFCCLTLFDPAREGGVGNWVYYAIEMYASLWQITVFTILWTFIEAYFDILSAKRLFPVLGGGGALGTMVGGGLVTALAGTVSVPGFFLIWSAMAIAAYPIIARLRSTYPKIEDMAVEEPQSLAEQVRHLGAAFKSSPYVSYLNLAVLLLMALTTICEYQYFTVLEKQGDAQALAALFGKMVIGVSLFNIIFSFFLFNRLVAVMGVRNTALIQPLVYLGIFSIFLIDLSFGVLEISLGTAVLGYFVCNGLQDVVEDNNWNFLLNPVSPQVNKSIRAFAEGVIDPLGASLAGVFLLLFVSADSGFPGFPVTLSPFHISATALVLAGSYFVVVLLLRHHYVGSMVANLRREWLDFSRPECDVLTKLDDAEQQQLLDRAAAADLADAQMAIRMLWLNHCSMAVRALLHVLSRVAPEVQDRFCSLLADMLDARDADTARQVLAWLEGEPGALSPRLIEVLGRYDLIMAKEWSHWLASPVVQERAAIAVSLSQSWDLESAIQALNHILQLLKGSEDEKTAGIRALGCLQQERYAHFLLPYLSDASPRMRRETLIAMSRLVNHESGRLIPHLLRIAAGGDTTSRRIAIEALGKIGDSDCIPALLAIAAPFVPYERRKVEQLILAMGARSVPGSLAVLRDPKYAYESRSIAARAVAKLAFPQLRTLAPELIEEEIERAYGYLYDHSVLTASVDTSPGLWVLCHFYMDTQLVILEFVLQLLALAGQLPDHEMMGSALRSQSLKARANAIEALEQACPGALFARLLPLVDTRPLGAKLDAYRCGRALEAATPQVVIARASRSAVPLERAAAAQAIWDTAAPDVMNALRQQLRHMPSGPFRDTVMTLLMRDEHDAGDTLIETVAYLSRTAFFAPLGIYALVQLAAGMTQTHCGADQSIYGSGDAARAVYVVKAGAVELCGQRRRRKKLPGEVFGEEAIYGTAVRRETAIAQAASLYVIELDFLMACARTHPHIALGLLEKHRGAHD